MARFTKLRYFYAGAILERKEMRELIESNHALGDRDALDRIWSEHGYWFFRDVLDKDAVGAMRDEYLAELRKLDLVDAGSSEPIWNGKPIENFPATFEDLHKRRAWQNFVKDPRINAFFEEVLADQIYWIPIDYYRLVAPSKTKDDKAYLGLHQDGMSNPGIEFVTCWIPLAEIDEHTGGIVIAEGQHQRGYMDVTDGKVGFSQGPAIPEDSWTRAHYQPDDVLIFTKSMPHYGLGNKSADRFRLSLDIRAMRRSHPLPVVGKVKTISADEVTVMTEEFGDVTLRLDDYTIVRGPVPGSPNPMPITRFQAPAELPPGTSVMATRDDGRALILRPHL
ncbi:MAG: phytanoyl-CoA dioxygenase [Sphingobium sp.]|nr:MAG: phytanoyl-CoA dioxygenase [Sphingobium sp.]